MQHLRLFITKPASSKSIFWAPYGLLRAPLRSGSLPRRTGGKGTKPFASLAQYTLSIER